MHTTILTMITSLLLPLIATVEAYWSPPVWPPDVKQPYYWGDVLNITKCYCEGVNEDTNAGHYYQFDYRNYHNEQEYTLAWTCESDAATTGWGMMGSKRVDFLVPDCWNFHDLWRKEKRKECGRSYNGDTFCFELGNTPDPYDYYYFNRQKRGLPQYGIREFPPDHCAALCQDKVGGRAVASDTEGGWDKSLPSLEHRLMTLRSSFQSYTALDDMTAN
ncbi:MAG: hypothetical protein Q9175_000417 [Cornicularia normoerica]